VRVCRTSSNSSGEIMITAPKGRQFKSDLRNDFKVGFHVWQLAKRRF